MTGPAGLLALIDLQRIFADPTSSWAAPRFAEVLAPTRKLVAAFAPRVVFTRFVAPSVPQGRWVDYYQQWPFALQPPDSDDYQLVPEFAGEPTLDATTFGKWDALADLLQPGDRLVLAGVSTDCCVLSTALAAADAGVHVQVVADACAGADDTTHANALAVMALYGPLVEVVTLADVVG
ncbi:cysteine hydrolase family protein [Nocardioides speluncae]|uniref:cysteine hydrolase family protein n=1 Tax=Nocardioides speluncae TaxID=2670337 RepID=UPI000D6983A2|nr:cysteine hydrolase [Nocardioides speluncae]